METPTEFGPAELEVMMEEEQPKEEVDEVEEVALSSIILTSTLGLVLIRMPRRRHAKRHLPNPCEHPHQPALELLWIHGTLDASC